MLFLALAEGVSIGRAQGFVFDTGCTGGRTHFTFLSFLCGSTLQPAARRKLLFKASFQVLPFAA